MSGATLLSAFFRDWPKFKSQIEEFLESAGVNGYIVAPHAQDAKLYSALGIFCEVKCMLTGTARVVPMGQLQGLTIQMSEQLEAKMKMLMSTPIVGNMSFNTGAATLLANELYLFELPYPTYGDFTLRMDLFPTVCSRIYVIDRIVFGKDVKYQSNDAENDFPWFPLAFQLKTYKISSTGFLEQRCKAIDRDGTRKLTWVPSPLKGLCRD